MSGSGYTFLETKTYVVEIGVTFFSRIQFGHQLHKWPCVVYNIVIKNESGDVSGNRGLERHRRSKATFYLHCNMASTYISL